MTPTVPRIGPIAAARLTALGEVLLLDVREREEWQAGHAPGAVPLPLGQLDAAQLPDNRTIVAVCRSGHRSGKAAAALTAAGRDVMNLTGGMTAWAAAGLPIVRADGSPGRLT